MSSTALWLRLSWLRRVPLRYPTGPAPPGRPRHGVADPWRRGCRPTPGCAAGTGRKAPGGLAQLPAGDTSVSPVAQPEGERGTSSPPRHPPCADWYGRPRRWQLGRRRGPARAGRRRGGRSSWRGAAGSHPRACGRRSGRPAAAAAGRPPGARCGWRSAGGGEQKQGCGQGGVTVPPCPPALYPPPYQGRVPRQVGLAGLPAPLQQLQHPRLVPIPRRRPDP